jgi:hypothetical protein
MKWLLAVGTVLAAGSAALAQDAKPGDAKPGDPAKMEAKQPETKPAENLPTGEALFEKHVKAIGGMEAMKAEKNRMVRAKYIGPGEMGEGMLRVLRVPPNKMYQTLEIPGVITQEVWCNGEEGWMRDTSNGTHRLQADSLVEYKRQADYFGEANYKARYKELKTTGAEKFNGVDAYAVRAVPTEGKERTLYFDAKSGLMIGIRTPGTSGPESDSITTFGEYKKFGEVMQPTAFSTKSKNSTSSITILEIRTDLTTMPSVEPPDEVRSVK